MVMPLFQPARLSMIDPGSGVPRDQSPKIVEK
jgi:hypothetical protein